MRAEGFKQARESTVGYFWLCPRGGRRITMPAAPAPGIVGLPNVGKSTLFNALCDTGEVGERHTPRFQCKSCPVLVC